MRQRATKAFLKGRIAAEDETAHPGLGRLHIVLQQALGLHHLIGVTHQPSVAFIGGKKERKGGDDRQHKEKRHRDSSTNG